MAARRPKRPRDHNQLAKLIVDISTGAAHDGPQDERKRALIESRREAGLKGGKSRAGALTPDQRAAIASVAANARWKHRK